MAVQSKPNVDDFINGAATAQTGTKDKENKKPKVPVSLRVDEDLLEAIDAMADKRGMSRNAFMCYWASKGLEAEE